MRRCGAHLGRDHSHQGRERVRTPARAATGDTRSRAFRIRDAAGSFSILITCTSATQRQLSRVSHQRNRRRRGAHAHEIVPVQRRDACDVRVPRGSATAPKCHVQERRVEHGGQSCESCPWSWCAARNMPNHALFNCGGNGRPCAAGEFFYGSGRQTARRRRKIDGSGRCSNRAPQAKIFGIWHLSHSEFHQEMRTTCSSLESQSGCPVQLSTRAPSPDRATGSFNCFPLEYRPPVKRAGGPPPLDSDRASREIIFLFISIALRARNFLLLIPIALRATLINSRRPD